jgi:hypothetical protein
VTSSSSSEGNKNKTQPKSLPTTPTSKKVAVGQKTSSPVQSRKACTSSSSQSSSSENSSAFSSPAKKKLQFKENVSPGNFVPTKSSIKIGFTYTPKVDEKNSQKLPAAKMMRELRNPINSPNPKN